MGPHALVREWIATRLAEWFELPTLDMAILDIDAIDEIPLQNGTIVAPGPSCVTRAAYVRDTIPEKLREACSQVGLWRG